MKPVVTPTNYTTDPLQGLPTVSVESHSVNDTLALGRRIGKMLKPGTVIALSGELGAGKTWMSKGIAYGLDVADHEYVNSPAFDIVHEYEGRCPVYHIDFYRLDALAAIDEAWLDEYVHGDGVCIIEWANKYIDHLTNSYLSVSLEATSDQDRLIRIDGVGDQYRNIVNSLKNR